MKIVCSTQSLSKYKREACVLLEKKSAAGFCRAYVSLVTPIKHPVVARTIF